MLWFLTIALLPVVLITVVTVGIAQQMLQTQVEGNLQQLADVTQSEIENYIGVRQTHLLALAESPALTAAAGQLASPVSGVDERAALEQEIGLLLGHNHLRQFDQLMFFTTSGDFIEAVPHAELKEGEMGGSYRAADLLYAQMTRMALIMKMQGEGVVQTSADGVSMICFGVPVVENGRTVGYLVAAASMQEINVILGRPSYFGETTVALLATQHAAGLQMLGGKVSGADGQVTRYLTDGSEVAQYLKAAAGGEAGIGMGMDHLAEEVVVAWRPLSVPGWSVAVKQNTAEVFALSQRQKWVAVVLAVLTCVTVIFIANAQAKRQTAPIIALSHGVEAIANGELATRIRVEQQDEIGKLAEGFNTMAGWLTALIVQFEERLQERTERLEQRSVQLEAAAEISSKVVALRDADELMRLVTHTIQERFDFYFVTILTADEEGEFLRPAAMAGTIAEASLNELGESEVHGEGIVGWVARNGRGRVASDVADDPLFKASPLLPKTLSEMALPLQREGRLLGVLDVQSDELDTFDISHVQNFQSMADQIAIALDNSRLYRESLGYVRHMVQALKTAEEANRAKNTFLANMSHELRTPLNAIIGFAQMMARDATIGEKPSEYLDIIQRSGQHLLSLINDVLDVAKSEAGHLSLKEAAFDLYDMLEEVELLFAAPAHVKNCPLEVVIGPAVPRYVHADSQKLRQVLINLLGNAVKFTDDGCIGLRVTVVASSAPDAGAYLRFEVADDGEGIAEAELKQVFKPFEQSQSGLQAKEGTGLGLTICHQVMKLMDGRIEIHSERGVGTTVTCDVPLCVAHAADVAQPRPERRVLEVAGADRYRIVVVDDRPATRRLMVDQLAAVGFQVCEAADGQQAVDLFMNWRPHLIWMDLRMPVMDGLEATRRIRAAEGGDDVFIIALTATVLPHERDTVEAAGCDDFVQKPLTEALMFDKLAQFLDVAYVHERPPLPIVVGPLKKSMTFEDADAALQVLPAEEVGRLRQAVEKLDLEETGDAIARISELNPLLSQRLADLVADYRFDQLQLLLQGTRVICQQTPEFENTMVTF